MILVLQRHISLRDRTSKTELDLSAHYRFFTKALKSEECFIFLANIYATSVSYKRKA
jgi:hypothetical protein